VSPAERWLRERVPGAPPELLELMVARLPAAEPAVPEALATAATHLYGEVVQGPGMRADALPLLAADALFTHAFEAQAEIDPAGIREFAARWGGGGRLGEVRV